VHHPNGSWSAHDPCLLTFELVQLRNWISTISDNKAPTQHIKFIEPNLEFSIHLNENSVHVLRVFFETDFRPSWAAADIIMRDLWLDFEVTSTLIAQFDSFLEGALSLFPVRVTT